MEQKLMKKQIMNKKLIFLGFLLALITGLGFPQTVSAQASAKVIKMEVKSERLTEALKRLEKLSNYKILFSYDDLSQFTVSNKHIKTKDIRAALNTLLAGKPVAYHIEGTYVNVFLDENAYRTAQRQQRSQTQSSQPAQQSANVELSGTVTDPSGEPLLGATVLIEGTGQGYSTNADGHFILYVPRGRQTTLRISYVGMGTVNRTFSGNRNETNLKIILEDDNKLQEVVVNGMFERRKSSYTGSTVTFLKDQLESVGNQNVIKSLANLDPSFQIVENLDAGSNPNSMPNLQLRGQTSFNIAGDYDGNANEPLFILDGFETTLEKIWDLDMNRVRSVTILKDAAAKAIYGSKAGNGVIVIETEKPKSGKLRISYNGNLNLEVPDLTGYNLMNAQEKFDWENQHHKYDNWQSISNPNNADLLYKSVYDAIASGVDTYWLSKPLRTGVGQKHTVSLEGGDSKVRYLLGASYNNVAGAMKGSDRNTFNINSTLSYTYKNMVFRNMMDYSHNVSNESPYGSFSDYVTLEPYFAPYDANGNLKKILGYETASGSNPVYNPLYNASLNVKNQSHYTTFLDNFEMDWHINEHWRFTGKLSYTHTDSGSDVFYPASHTMFIDYDAAGNSDRKGRYTKGNGSTDDLSLQAGLSWNHSWGKHNVFANANWNLQNVTSKSTTIVAEGFGNDQMDDISQANYYYHDSHPTGSDSKTREVGFVEALNYSYAERYLLDLSLRETGSSVYGADNHWGTFWSTGVGWNIHNEPFMKSVRLIKLLKLRYSLGYIGTQNFNPYQARAKYSYGTTYYDGHQGTTLLALPNTGLKWQKIYDNNWGVDFALGDMLTGRVDYYIQNTSNLLSDITIPASTGFTTYKENMGEIQNKGIEFYLGFTPWRQNSSRSWITFTASAAHNKNKIKKIYDIFKKSNDDADANFSMTFNDLEQKLHRSLTADEFNAYLLQNNRPATRYFEGQSMTAIWGMKSLGIDPAIGKELYEDTKGNPTWDWSAAEQQVIGDTNPKWHGTLGISGGWHGWTLSITASYKLGGDLYNSTLVDRVENITGFGNLDKRVYDVWTTPGQIAPYRGVNMLSSPTDTNVNITKPTSRFVQRNNELYISNLNIGYDFFRQAWIHKMGMERLKLSFQCNELARITSVKVERGLTYPFARTFSFSLSATF